ncbi:hypothetical protein GCM10009838_34930 [Catenulispora subtropica]|uniref:Uncharacterized protein n=1 Tax=Catenulispora subtropica TaxID=450798 RepID=A0ABN2RP10_9ACTN
MASVPIEANAAILLFIDSLLAYKELMGQDLLCSLLGMVRREAAAINDWSTPLVAHGSRPFPSVPCRNAEVRVPPDTA